MSSRPDYLPSDYNGIFIAGSEQEFLKASFGPANVILYPRRLSGDFNALARALAHHVPEDNISSPELGEQELTRFLDILPSSYHPALLRILDDMALADADIMSLRIVGSKGYTHNPIDAVVHDYHQDEGIMKNERGRILCCYNTPVTQGLRNEDAVLSDPQGLYRPKPGAVPFAFHPGDIWRQVVGSQYKVPPFIHRAPTTQIGDPPRLLLTAG